MGIFRRKKKQPEPEPGLDVEVEERERFSHSSGSSLDEVVGHQSPKYDRENPPPAPRGRAARLHPEDEARRDEFWK